MIAAAIKMAELNDTYPKWRIAAILVKGGSVQSRGLSKKCNDPKIVVGAGCSVHAEAAALRKVRHYDVTGAIIYIARIGRDGNVKLAKPCNECKQKLLEAGVKKVIYTTSNGPKTERIYA